MRIKAITYKWKPAVIVAGAITFFTMFTVALPSFGEGHLTANVQEAASTRPTARTSSRVSSSHVSSSRLPSASVPRAIPPVEARTFTLKDAGGRLHSLAEYHGRSVALFFFCGCPWCHRCATIWGQFQRSGVLNQQSENSGQGQFITSSPSSTRSPLTLIVFSGDSASVRTFAEQTGLDLEQTVLLPDPDIRVTTLYKVDPCPRVFALNSQGRVRYTNNHKDDVPQEAPELVMASRALNAVRGSATPPSTTEGR